MQRTRLFVWIFGVPLGGVLVAGTLAAHLETQLPRALLNAAGNSHVVDSGMRQRAYASTMADVCGGGPDDQGVQDLCGAYRHLRWIRKASSASLLLGLFMVGAPWAAGLAARSNRQILLYLFTSGLYGTLVLTAVLIVLNAAILIASAYFLTAIFPGRALQWMLLFVAMGAIYGAWSVIHALTSLPQRASVTVLGLPTSADRQPGLWAYVQRLAQRTSAAVPDHIVIGLEPEFFVTEIDVRCLVGELKGRTVFLSLPLLRMLALSELSAVIAHELAHFKGVDTKFSKSFYPVYRGTEAAMMQLALLSEGGQSSLLSFGVLPGLAALNHFYTCFAEAENKISRERELAADAVAAETSGRASTASALVKLHAYAPLWDSFVACSRGFLKKGRNYAMPPSSTFAEGVASRDFKELTKDLVKTRSAHPTDSHPPLGVRLDALGITLDEVAENASAIKPADPTARLLSDIDMLDEALSQAHTPLLAHDLGVELQPEAQA